VGPQFTLKASLSQPITSHVPIAMPAKIHVRCQQVAKAGGMPKFGSGVWIGLYRHDDKDGVALTPQLDKKNYAAFDWICNGKEVTPLEDKTKLLVEREVTFEVPKAGQWYLRLFSDRSYNDVASTAIHIAGEDRLELSVSGQEMKINCYVNTVDPLRDYVWVGVYKVEEKDQRQYRRYKYLVPNSSSSTSSSSTPSSSTSSSTSSSSTSTSSSRYSGAPHSTLVFKAPIHSGVYEARLFANKSYEVLTRSEPVTIHGI
jgi:hypothetical protein